MGQAGDRVSLTDHELPHGNANWIICFVISTIIIIIAIIVIMRIIDDLVIIVIITSQVVTKQKFQSL